MVQTWNLVLSSTKILSHMWLKRTITTQLSGTLQTAYCQISRIHPNLLQVLTLNLFVTGIIQSYIFLTIEYREIKFFIYTAFYCCNYFTRVTNFSLIASDHHQVAHAYREHSIGIIEIICIGRYECVTWWQPDGIQPNMLSLYNRCSNKELSKLKSM
jgi:hypothetical protein